MRKSYEELNELKKQLNTDILWSWSRINSIHNSLFEYFLKYVKHAKEDRDDCIYRVTGGIGHDIQEKFYKNEIKYEDLIEEFDDGWDIAMMADLKFDRSDSERNKQLANTYYKNLKHFFTHHVPIKTKMQLEQFIVIKIGDEYLNGYIDACTKDADGCYRIIDWKTSSIYKGDKALNECGQLVVYAIGLHQLGVPYDKIKIAWDFMKYTNVLIDKDPVYNVTWTTVKGEEKVKEKLDMPKLIKAIKASAKAWLKEVGMDKAVIESTITQMEDNNDITVLPKEVQDKFTITPVEVENTPRQIERSKIGDSLYANVKSQLKKAGYSEDDSFTYLDMLVQTNDIECLPDDVKSKYHFDDCFVYVELTDELIQHWIDYVTDTIKMIREKEKAYNKTKDEKIWWEDDDTMASESYYMSNLSGYSANLHKPYAAYLDRIKAEKEGDVFGGSPDSKDSSEYADDDLAWLNDL